MKMLRIRDDKLHQALKAEALREGRSIETVVEAALRAYLSTQTPPDPPKPPRKPKPGMAQILEDAAGRVETFGPPINTTIRVCRRCNHAAAVHTRLAQRACALAGCNCSRLM